MTVVSPSFQLLHPRLVAHLHSWTALPFGGGAWSKLQESKQFHERLPAGEECGAESEDFNVFRLSVKARTLTRWGRRRGSEWQLADYFEVEITLVKLGSATLSDKCESFRKENLLFLSGVHLQTLLEKQGQSEKNQNGRHQESISFSFREHDSKEAQTLRRFQENRYAVTASML